MDLLVQKWHCLLLTETLAYRIIEQDTFWEMDPWGIGTPRSIHMSQIQWIQCFIDPIHDHHSLASCNLHPKVV